MSELISYAFNKYNKCSLFVFFFFSKNNNFNNKFSFGVLLFISDSTYGSFWKIDFKIKHSS